MLHCLNTCKICQEYSFIMIPRRYDGLHAEQPATVAYIKLTSHSLWMLVSGELRLTLYSELSTLQIKKKCHYSPSIAKLNYITTVLIFLAHMWAPTLSPTQTVDMWTLTVRWHSSWPAWHPFTNCSLVQQHILKCSSSAGDQQGKQQWGKCQCLLWRSGVSFSCFISI